MCPGHNINHSHKAWRRSAVFGPTEYAFAAMCCFGISDFIYKRSAGTGIKPMHFITSQTLVFCPLIVGYAWLTGTLVLIPAALWNGIAGLFMLIGFLHFFKSLTTGSVSVNAPIFRLNFIVTAALAILILHESVSILKVTAVAFAVAAAWLLLGIAGRKTAQTIDRRSFMNVAIATIALGSANFFHKLGLSAGVLPETGIVASASVFCALATIMTILKNRKFDVPSEAWKHSSPAAVALVCAFLFLLHALTNGPASVLVPIAQMGFIVPAVLGIAFLGERLTARKVGGLAAAVAALGALAAS
jgi:uncharacterized membrane protein